MFNCLSCLIIVSVVACDCVLLVFCVFVIVFDWRIFIAHCYCAILFVCVYVYHILIGFVCLYLFFDGFCVFLCANVYVFVFLCLCVLLFRIGFDCV